MRTSFTSTMHNTNSDAHSQKASFDFLSLGHTIFKLLSVNLTL